MSPGLQATSDPLSPMLQLPHMDAGLLKKLSRSGVKQLGDLMGMDSIARLQALQSAGESPALLKAASAGSVYGACCWRVLGVEPAGGVAGVLEARVKLSPLTCWPGGVPDWFLGHSAAGHGSRAFLHPDDSAGGWSEAVSHALQA